MVTKGSKSRSIPTEQRVKKPNISAEKSKLSIFVKAKVVIAGAAYFELHKGSSKTDGWRPYSIHSLVFSHLLEGDVVLANWDRWHTRLWTGDDTQQFLQESYSGAHQFIKATIPLSCSTHCMWYSIGGPARWEHAREMCCVRESGETEAQYFASLRLQMLKSCDWHFPEALPLGGVKGVRCLLGRSDEQQHQLEPLAGIYVFQTPSDSRSSAKKSCL